MPPAVHSLLQQSLPLPFVAVLVLQTAGFVWLGSDKFNAINTRLALLEKVVEAQVGQKDRIIILEQGMAAIKDDLAEIKQILRNQGRRFDYVMPKGETSQ